MSLGSPTGGADPTAGVGTVDDGDETRRVDSDSLAFLATTEPKLAMGSTLGRYVLLRELGRGGMAVVHVAYDPELDRRIALKLVRPRRGGAGEHGGQQRLLREAQALARLSHPNVVQVYDVGIYEDRVYIAMELVEGVTLREWLLQKPRSWRTTLDVLVRAGRGLAAAHAVGLMHLDFKPGNVLLETRRPADATGRVRVVDFGLARERRRAGRAADIEEPGPSPMDASLDDDDDSDCSPTTRASHQRRLGAQLTEHGAVMGTPGYIAPEQLRGEEPDARSDQFSFCVSVWEALYGRRPFLGNDRRQLEQAILAGRTTEPPDDRGVPLWVRRIVERGLQVRPEKRYPRMDALLDALRRDPVRERRRRLGFVAAVVGVGAAGFGYYRIAVGQRVQCKSGETKIAEVWNDATRDRAQQAFAATGVSFASDVWSTARSALDHYAVRWSEQYRDACEATHVRGDQSSELLDLRMHCLEQARHEMRALVQLFGSADVPVVRNAVDAVTKLTRPEDDCADPVALRSTVKLPSDPQTRAAVEVLGADIARAKELIDAGRLVDARELGAEIVRRAEEVGHDPTVAAASVIVGNANAALGKGEAAEQALSRALFAAERSGLDLRRSGILVELTYVVGYLQGDFERGQFFVRSASEVLERVGGRSWERSRLYSNEAVLASAQGRNEEALAKLEKALALHEKTADDDERNEATILNNIGSTHYASGNYEKALVYYQRAHAIRLSTVGNKHPEISQSMENLANAYHGLGRNEEALEFHREALRIAEEAGMATGARHGQLLNNVAVVLNSLQRYEEAAAYYERGIALYRDESPDHPMLGVMLANLGEALIRLGRPKEAMVQYEEGLEAMARALPEDHAYRAFALTGKGWAHLELGEPDHARETLDRALRILEHKPADPALTAEAEFLYARALTEPDPDDPAVWTRARTLAERSRETLERRDTAPELLARVESWLKAHQR